MGARTGPFMPPSLLASQLATLEAPRASLARSPSTLTVPSPPSSPKQPPGSAP